MSMTEQAAFRELSRVFDAYPSFRSFLGSLADGEGNRIGNRTIDAWAKMLTGCDEPDVVRVVNEIIDGSREPYSRFQKQDMLARNIREAANDLRSKRNERNRTRDKYLSHEGMNKLRSGDKRFGFAWREVLAGGELVKSGDIERDEADRRCKILVDWMNHRVENTELDWLDEVPAI